MGVLELPLDFGSGEVAAEGGVVDLVVVGRRNGTLRLGAGVTFGEVLESPLAGMVPALAEAARTVGGPVRADDIIIG